MLVVIKYELSRKGAEKQGVPVLLTDDCDQAVETARHIAPFPALSRYEEIGVRIYELRVGEAATPEAIVYARFVSGPGASEDENSVPSFVERLKSPGFLGVALLNNQGPFG